MAQSQLNLYNLALSIAGSDFTIAAVNEKSVPAETCQLWYENVRQVVLRSAHWSSARRHVRLDLDAERGSGDWTDIDPEPGYIYSYEVPSDVLAVRYLTTFAEFSFGYGYNRKTISTNEGGNPTPILVYTTDLTNVTLWEPDLYQAMAYSLAAHVTMPLTGKSTRRTENINLAYQFVLTARANTANEMHRMLVSRPETLAGRGYNYTTSAPFIYPYGSFFAGAGAGLL